MSNEPITNETEAQWDKAFEIINEKEEKILQESIKNGRFESPPISLATYQAWYSAMIVVVENCYHFIPPSVYNSKYTYKNHETYLSSYFSFYVSLALYKSTGKHFIDCTLTELCDFVAQSPFLSSFAQAYHIGEGVYGFELVFGHAPFLTEGLPTFKICDGKFGYWADSWEWNLGDGIRFSSNIKTWASACFKRKEAYFSKYPQKKAEYTKLYENCITRKNAYIIAAQQTKSLHEELETLNAQVNGNTEDINRLKKAILFKAKSIQKAEILQQENNKLTQDILKKKQECDQFGAEIKAFRADFGDIEEDYDDEVELESEWQSKFERYIAAKMDYYIIWKWSDN